MNEGNQIHEGAMTTAAIEAAKLLWMRHAPIGNFEISVSRLEIEFFKSQFNECRLRMELSEVLRETMLAEIRERRSASSLVELKIFDENEQAVAQVQLQLQFKHTPALA